MVDLAQKFISLERQALERAQGFAGPTASRKAQLIAACLLPFFVVTTFVAAGVVKEIIISVIPTTSALVGMVGFITGAALLLGSCALCFAWVKTGGFRLFE